MPTGDTTKAMPAMVEERDSLTAEDEAAVNALPYGSALLIVQRGANAGSRFLLDTDLVTPDGMKIPTSSSTTSLCPAVTPRSAVRRRAPW